MWPGRKGHAHRVADPFAAQEGESERTGHDALCPRSGLGQPEVARMMRSRGEPTREPDQALPAGESRTRRTISGTAAAASSLLTVTRTICEPAAANANT